MKKIKDTRVFKTMTQADMRPYQLYIIKFDKNEYAIEKHADNSLYQMVYTNVASGKEILMRPRRPLTQPYLMCEGTIADAKRVMLAQKSKKTTAKA